MVRSLAVGLLCGVACISRVVPGSAAEATPWETAWSHERLAESPWRTRGWSNRSFVFMTYAGAWDERRGDKPLMRAAYECEVHNLLTPTWSDPEFQHPIEVKGSEWDNVFYRYYLDDNREKRNQLRASDRVTLHDTVRRYYLDQLNQPLYPAQHRHGLELDGRRRVMTGNSWYSVYMGQWGGELLSQEIGIRLFGTHSKLAFLRGACRQNDRAMCVQVSSWLSGRVPTFDEKEGLIGTLPTYRLGAEVKPAKEIFGHPRYDWDGGHSPSSLQRLWFMGWLSGADVVIPEPAQMMFFAYDPERHDEYVRSMIFVPKDQNERAVLSPVGERAQQFMEVTGRHPDRGIPFTPFAILLDQYAGFGGIMHEVPRPWGLLEPTLGDREIQLFWDTVFAGSMALSELLPYDDSGETITVGDGVSLYGNSFDVLLSNVSPDVLAAYPVLTLLGDHNFTPDLIELLTGYVRSGGHLCLTYAQAEILGESLDALRAAGRVEMFGLKPEDIPARMNTRRWINSPRWGLRANVDRYEALRRDMALLPYEEHFKNEVRALYDQLAETYLPVRVDGSVDYYINRTSDGWVIGLINHQGVIKRAVSPVELDASKQQQVRVTPKYGTWKIGEEWVTGDTPTFRNGTIELIIPAGETRILELRAN
jgi:hypothetical protein